MLKYKIIGDDKREYGPVGVDELRAWIQEGRANGQSLVQPDGTTGWQPLQTIPELAALLHAVANAPAPFSATPTNIISPAQKNNGLAIAGFVCSLVGLLCCATGLFSLVGLVLSIVGLVQINRDETQRGRGLAIAGILLSILGLLIAVAFWVLFFTGIVNNLD